MHRQFAVNDKAIPPWMNADINRCRACKREWDRTRDPEAVCSRHAQHLRQYAREIGPPSPLKYGGHRIHHTVQVTEDAQELDMGMLRDQGQEKIGRLIE